MTIGTALVIIMLLYLLDKHGLLRRSAAIVAILSFVGLVWIFGARGYEEWAAYKHRKITATLIAKYEHAIPDPPSGFTMDTSHVSVPLDELDKQQAGAQLMLNDLCKESSFKQLTENEQDEVVKQVWPGSHDIFDRLEFIKKCH